MIYKDLYPEMADIRFQSQDFIKLEEDDSIDKLYTNTGLDFFYVHAVSNPSITH